MISDSFLLGLIMGRPFEISIALQGEVCDSYNVDKRYWRWFKALANNITIDRLYLKNVKIEDLRRFKSDIKDALIKNDKFGIIMAGYHICSELLKIYILQVNLSDVLRAHQIFNLSQAKYLLNHIEKPELKIFYSKLVENFKLGTIPKNIKDFMTELEQFVNYYEDLIKLNKRNL